jgi:hypothetical protein
MSIASVNPVGDAWAELRRLEAWAGEARVNLIRVAAILVFYAQHVLNVYVFRDDPSVAGSFHLATTALTVSWAILAFVIYFLLLHPQVSPVLKYAATVADLALLTLLLAQAGGVKSPLVVLYFVVIAAAALRLSLPLVYVATLGSIASYLFLLGAYAWYQVGWEEYYTNPAVRIPRTQQVILVLTLGLAGFLAGQMVRQTRRLVRGYLATSPGAIPAQEKPLDAEVRQDTIGSGAILAILGVLGTAVAILLMVSQKSGFALAILLLCSVVGGVTLRLRGSSQPLNASSSAPIPSPTTHGARPPEG